MPDHTVPITHADRLRATEAAVADLRSGLPVVVGAHAPLAVLAAETADLAGLAAIRRLSTGVPSLLLQRARAASLLPGTDPSGPAVALSIDGLQLRDIQTLADPTLPPLAQIPPQVEGQPGGETALALAVLARLLPAVIVAPAAGRIGLSEREILQHAALSAAALERISEAPLPLEDAPDARIVAFRSPGSGAEQYAVLIGRPEEADAPLVRVHSECFTGDLLGSLRCDCGSQLRGAIRRIAAEGAGAILYLAQEGRGIGLPNKLRAYTLQDRGLDTMDANLALGFRADERDFLSAAAMLRQLGLTRIRLLTNNPDKLASLAAHGIEVVGRASLLFAANGVNDRYLLTKATRFGHLPG